MKYFFYLAILTGLFACGNQENKGANEDPQQVHPPHEAIPDSMHIRKDSTIVPDSPANRPQER